MLKKSIVIFSSIILLLAINAYPANAITGKVIGIADGDTITILDREIRVWS